MENKSVFGSPEVLKYTANHVSIAVSLNRTAFAAVATANGGKIPAGTFLSFNKEARATKAVPVTEQALAAGILRYDVDYASYSEEADHVAAIVEGYVDLKKLPVQPSSAVKTALPQVTFLR